MGACRSFVLLSVLFFHRSAEPGVCEDVLAPLQQQCESLTGGEWASLIRETSEGLLTNRCDTTGDGQQSLFIQAIVAEAGFADDPSTRKQSETSRFVFLMDKTARAFQSFQTLNALAPLAAHLEKQAETFTNPGYQRLCEGAADLLRGRESAMPVIVETLKRTLILSAHPIFPLESICLYAPRHGEDFLQDARIPVMQLLLAMAITRPKVPETDFEQRLDPQPPFHSATLVLLKTIVDNDPLGLYRNNLQHLLHLHIRAQLGTLLNSKEDDEDTVGSFSNGLVNYLADLAGSTGYLKPIGWTDGNTWASDRMLFDPRLSERDTVDLLFPAHCETGHHRGALSEAGFLEEKPDSSPASYFVRPFEMGDEWYFETIQDGRSEHVHNGFYRNQSIYLDPLTGATHYVVKIPPSELARTERKAVFGLRLFCRGYPRLYEITVPLFKSLDSRLEDFEEQTASEPSPRYSEMDRDQDGDGMGYRRGVFYSGPRSRDGVYLVADYLQKERGFTCSKRDEVPLVDTFLDLLRRRGDQTLDYVVRDSHANAYIGTEGDRTFFYSYSKGVVYRCTRKQKSPFARVLVQEVFLLGSDDKSPDQPKEPVPLFAFTEAVRESGRTTQLLTGNISCTTETQSGTLLCYSAGLPVKTVATQRASHRITNLALPERDTHLALFIGIIDGLDYKTMKDRFPVLAEEEVLTPEHPEYTKRLQAAIERSTNHTHNITVSRQDAGPRMRIAELLESGQIQERYLNQEEMDQLAQDIESYLSTHAEDLLPDGKQRLTRFVDAVKTAELDASGAHHTSMEYLRYLGTESRLSWLKSALQNAPRLITAKTLWSYFGPDSVSLYTARELGDRGNLYLAAVLEHAQGWAARGRAARLKIWTEVPEGPARLIQRIPFEMARPYTVDDIAQTLAPIGKKILPALLDAWDSSASSRENLSYLDVFEQLGPLENADAQQVAHSMQALLEHPADHQTRTSLARAAGRALRNSETSLPILLEQISDPSWDIQLNVVLALGDIGGDASTVVPALISVAAAPGTEGIVQREIYRALGKYAARGETLASDFVIHAYLSALVAPDPFTKNLRFYALQEAIGRFGRQAGPRIIDPLLLALNSKKTRNVLVGPDFPRFLISLGPETAVPASFQLLKTDGLEITALSVLQHFPEHLDSDFGILLDFYRCCARGNSTAETMVLHIFMLMGSKAFGARDALLEAMQRPGYSLRIPAALALLTVSDLPPEAESVLVEMLANNRFSEATLHKVPTNKLVPVVRKAVELHGVAILNGFLLHSLAADAVPLLGDLLAKANPDEKGHLIEKLVYAGLSVHFRDEVRRYFMEHAEGGKARDVSTELNKL